MNKLKGKVVLVGGGGKHLGGDISRMLAAEGAKLALHYHSDAGAAAAKKIVDEITKEGGKAIAIQGDFTQAAQLKEVFAAARREYGGIDIAINTVGKGQKKSFAHTSEEEYLRIAAINGLAAYHFIQEAGRQLNTHGKICSIVTSRWAGVSKDDSNAASSQTSVEQFTLAASKQFGQRDISVTAIGSGLGPVAQTTAILAGPPSEKTAEHYIFPGHADTAGIVPLVKFLVTDGWWMSGQTLFANSDGSC
jgi:NAD(P)-dependent dehydrogenase (short-subunit alcohol dehydrogenase family)